MKQFFGFLLICIAYGYVHAGSNSLEGKCNKPAEVFVVWANNDCAMDAVFSLAQNVSTLETFTKQHLRDFANNYCIQIRPQVRECFRVIAERDCSSTQATLMGYADDTSSICNSGTGNTLRQDVLSLIEGYPEETENLDSFCDIDFRDAPMFNPMKAETLNFEQYAQNASREFELEADAVMKIAEQRTEGHCSGGRWRFQGLKRVVYDSGKTRPEPYNVRLTGIEQFRQSYFSSN